MCIPFLNPTGGRGWNRWEGMGVEFVNVKYDGQLKEESDDDEKAGTIQLGCN
jgi:hypothetical protein